MAENANAFLLQATKIKWRSDEGYELRLESEERNFWNRTDFPIFSSKT